MSDRPEAGSRVVVGLALTAFVVATASVAPSFVSSTWIIRDCRFHVNVNQTIVESGSLEQHAFASSWYDDDLGWNRNLDPSWSNVALGRNGEYWPKHTWLLPVFGTPLYFAFGLLGTLIFNLAMFGWIAAAGFRFSRAYASPTAAAVAVGIFLFGTAILDSAYNYSADLLQVAFFVTGLAMAVSRRPIPAGVFVALAVIVRPTALMLMLSPVLVYVERRRWRELGHALLAGLGTLTVFAAINTGMYGRPWWTGYNRTVITVNGSPAVASHVDSFGVPVGDGLRRMFFGNYPLGRAFAVLLFAIPGVVALLRRRRWTMFGLLAGVGLSVYVFARYSYEGHRFHWIALSLSLPALATSADWVASCLARHARHRLPLLAGVGAVVVCVAALPFEPIDQRIPRDDWRVATESLADGRIDLHAVYGEEAFAETAAPELSRVAEGPGGIWLARVSPPAVLIGAPFAAAGPYGLAFLHLLALGLSAFFATLILRRHVPEPIAALVVSAPLMIPLVRDAAMRGGPLALALPMVFAALYCGERRRWILAGALSAGAAWVADSLLFAMPALLPLLLDRKALGGVARGACPVLALYALSSLVLFGWPFASPESVVVVGDSVVAVPRPGLLHTLEATMTERGSARLLWPFVALAPLGVIAAWQRDRRHALVLLMLGLTAFGPGVATRAGSGDWNPLIVLLLTPPLALLVDAVARSWTRVPTRYRKVSFLTVVVLSVLGSIGLGRRIAASAEPFRLSSFEGVRGAVVLLGGRVPCDFLAWEHLSWECAQVDQGLGQMVGRATSSEEFRVGGVRREWLLVPSGADGRARTVTWPEVDAGAELFLRWAVFDGHLGGGTLTVRIDDEVRATIDVPRFSDGEVHEVRIPTPELAEGRARLQLEMRSATRAVALVGVEGEWR